MDPPGVHIDLPDNQEHDRRPRCAGPCRWPRARLCLLKGCEERFHPYQGSQRYCSETCQKAARRWSRWKAQQKYRGTHLGKAKRNAQSRRHRERIRKRNKAAIDRIAGGARVITTNAIFDGSCDRPGCYERFLRSRRSPLQRFCSEGCRCALERVLKRERHWRRSQLSANTDVSHV